MTMRTAADVLVARRLLAQESPSGADPAARAAAVAHAYEKLAERLSPLIGTAGVRALLARSVKLTKADFPCFATLVVPVDHADHSGATEQLAACLRTLEPEASSAAAAALFGCLLGLLNGFIGERLVQQILRGAFPAFETSVTKETE